jgi:hypothetical protein
MRKALKSKELAYLESYGARELTAETKTAIGSERMMLEDEPLYIRKQISGGGEIELLTSNLNESVGVTNIDKKKLPKYVNFILSGIQFSYATAASGTKTAVQVVYSSLIADCPVQLQHANLIIKQNDNPIVTMPIKELLQQEKIRGSEGDNGYEFKYMRLIKEEVPFQISIKFPDDEVLPGGVDHFAEVRIKGTRTRLRGAK